MTIRLNGSTSGFTEIDAPAVAANNTLTLPTTTSGSLVALDSSGRLGIGTVTPDALLTLKDSGDTQLTFKNSSGTTKAYIGTSGALGSAATDDLRIRSDGSNILFGLSGTERLRIDNGGAVSIGTTGNPGPATFGIAFGRAGNTGLLEQSRNVSGSTVAAAFGGNAGLAYVMGDGDLENTNNRYTGISDIKFKQNIEDASSQWDDIKSIQVRKYELIANPDRKHIGCVAQELEQVCPGLVIEREDQEGEPYKSVAYSVLYMKAVKALQEAIAKIETLEGMVAVNNITIDEQQHQLSTLAARLTALEAA